LKKNDIPFVGLHAHTVAGSIYDALGYPAEHFDFCYDNGMDAMAITDHGNMNSLAHGVLHVKKMQTDGKSFKMIFGCEAYFVPSVAEWKEEYEKTMQDKKAARSAKKSETSGATVEDEKASKRSGRNPLNTRSHLVLLVQNQKGLNNLFKIISESYSGDNFYRYPRVDYDMLKKYGEGIIASSACLGGVLARCLWENRDEGPEAVLAAMRVVTERMQAVLGDRWYGELQWNNVPEQHELNKYIIQICEEYGVELISTADSHYPNPDAWKDRELYKRLGWMGKGRPAWADNDDLPVSVDEIGYELYPKNGQQMWESYKKYSKICETEYDDDLVLDSITRTYKIAHERIERFMPDNTVRLPDFVIPAGETADSALRKLCFEGLRTKGLHASGEYTERLEYELGVISERGFSKYFLTMDKIMEEARKMMLIGPGRGSAAGALVSYSLNITQVDPLKYGLQFERFLRADATDYPDIDVDVSEPMILKEELVKKWGDNVVAPISNWNTLQLKSLIKDISKFYGISFIEANAVTGKMMYEATMAAKKAHDIKTGVYVPTFEEVKMYSPTLQAFLAKYPEVAVHVDALYGQNKSCSRHAGGVVVAEDLDWHMPLISSKNVRQTPWSEGQNVRHLEPMGFIKYDLLGLSTLRMIEGAVSHILKRHHGIEDPTFENVLEYYNKHLHPDVMNLEDQAVYEKVFQGGTFPGIFQYTESGAQALCMQIQPKNMIDLSIITSVYRPGPLGSGVDKDLVEMRANKHKVKYINDIHKEITESTSGFLIFQEQIASLVHKLGKDLSLDEGNLLRKVLTKKGTGKAAAVKNRIYDKFMKGCEEKGISKAAALKLRQDIEFFHSYGFNKSHAVCYSVISYQCAWLFTHYPAEWMAAFLDKEPETRKEKAIAQAESLGFEIEPLNINTSGKVWEISKDGKTLIQPLSSIKGLGVAAIEEIYKGRPFLSVEEFLFSENVIYSKLNKKMLDVLCRSGTLNILQDERFTGSRHFWSAIAVDRPRKIKNLIENINTYAPEGDFTEEEKLQFLVDLTGQFPVHKVVAPETMTKLDNMGIPPISEFDPELQVTWVIPRKVTTKKTKNGKDYLVVDVTDSNSSNIRIRCWGVDLRGGDHIQLNKPYMIRPQYNLEWGFSTRGRAYKTWKMLG
jgi:DNA polymerase III subunit alpha